MKVVAQFEIPYYQYMDEASQLAVDSPKFAYEQTTLLSLYQRMVFSRLFDAKAIALQRTGKMGTYPSIRGQEAVFVGVGSALPANDIFVPYYRDIPILMQRNVDLSQILLYWGGDERGNMFADANYNFPYSVPIGTQVLHAAGVATALKIRHEKRAVLVMCGDGATSEGDFYEAMNVAGVWQLPIVFVVNNNQWAISVSRDTQTASVTLAQKAIAAGFMGEQVDGNDVIAVHARTERALQQAREHHTPTLIEIVSYRHCDHTTADDASRYESKANREAAWEKEPIQRLKRFIEKMYGWSAAQEEALIAVCVAEVDHVVEKYLNVDMPLPESMFDYLYATLPSIYDDQYNALKQRGECHG